METRVVLLEPAGGPAAPAAAGGIWAHSDTLLAALCCAAQESGILRESFRAGKPPFTVSSIFTESGGVRLYPRPFLPPPGTAAEISDAPARRETLVRAWKGIAWISEARLESLASGKRARFLPEASPSGCWCLDSERPVIEEGLASPRRFFLARFEDAGARKALDELAAALGEAGLGARRSSGRGLFRWVSSRPAPAFLDGSSPAAGEPPAGAARQSLLLSLYLPARGEIEAGVLEGAGAEICRRGGWIHSGGATPLRKRPVHMIREGSILNRIPGGAAGEVRDVAPAAFGKHPVWRDGRAFCIPIRSPGDPSGRGDRREQQEVAAP